MSKQDNIDMVDATEPQVTPLTVGQWLIQARQAKGLSVHEVSSRTNRSLKQIEALEGDNLASFGSPNMLRAVVRHYAKVVEADQEEAVRHLPAELQATPPASAPSTQTSTSRIGEKMSMDGKPMKSAWISKGWLILLALIVIGLLTYWVLFSRFLQKQDGAQKITEPNQVQVVTPPVAPAAVAEVAAPAAPSVPTDSLNLKFNVKSWVEIKDAKGTVLLSGDQQAGTESTGLTGELPLKVKIGNASQVEATWKGQPLDLKAAIANKAKDVAKIDELK